MLFSKFIGQHWTCKIPLQRLKYKKYISVPGKDVHLYEVMSNRVLEGNETLSTISIDDTYISHFKVETCRYFTCHKDFMFDKIVVSNFDNLVHREYYITYVKDNVTWREAASMCNDTLGGHLPTFETKNSLYELLSLFRSYDIDDMAPPDAIYIGLVLFTPKASDQLFTS